MVQPCREYAQSSQLPAVLVREHGFIQGIVTRSDMLSFMMAR